MKKNQYNSFIGKYKDQIIEEFGQDFNFYSSDVWFYEIEKNWLGRKTYLLILFKNQTVNEIKIKKSWGKLHLKK